MARLNPDPPAVHDPYESDEDLYTDPRQRHQRGSSSDNSVAQSHPEDSASSAPSPSAQSDKENNQQMPPLLRSKSGALASKASAAASSSKISTKTAAASSSRASTTTASASRTASPVAASSSIANPRKRKSDVLKEAPPSISNGLLYDPDQDPEERREVRRHYRDLHRELVDNKSEYLKPDNNTLVDVFTAANTHFQKVKQTADATLDSRLLVTAATYAQQRATNLTSGASGSGLDVEDFIAKTIAFLKNAPRAKDVQFENAYDWAYLGKRVAIKASKRPATSDFMLGPLGIVKKQRVIKERKRVVRHRPEEVVRPEDLDQKKIAKNENSTTKNVMDVAKVLDDCIRNVADFSLPAVSTSFDEEDGDEDSKAINYFCFVVNPHSYSQTVENIFYTAFLIRDGRCAVREKDGLLWLMPTEPLTPEESAQQQMVRKQIIMSMDKPTWRRAIRTFNIKEPLIPSRLKEGQAINGSGWYS